MATREQLTNVLNAIVDWRLNAKRRIETGETDGAADIARLNEAMSEANIEACRYRDTGYVMDGGRVRSYYMPHIMELMPD